MLTMFWCCWLGGGRASGL